MKKEPLKETKPLKIAAPLKEVAEAPKLEEETKDAEKLPVEAPKKEITKADKILKLEKYIEDLQGMLQQLETKFQAGSISQEEFLEKSNTVGQKLDEATSQLEQLKGE